MNEVHRGKIGHLPKALQEPVNHRVGRRALLDRVFEGTGCETEFRKAILLRGSQWDDGSAGNFGLHAGGQPATRLMGNYRISCFTWRPNSGRCLREMNIAQGQGSLNIHGRVGKQPQ